MAQIQFNQLLKMENDGLVFYGLNDELEDFKTIINKELNNENIGTGNFEDKFKGHTKFILKTEDETLF